MHSRYIETLPDGTHFEMIHVEGGTFMIGDDNGEHSDEKPAHPVKLDEYFIGKYPVTQAIWKAVMGQNKNPSFFQGDDRPVETVSWEDCQIFLKRLAEISKKSYRLPSEAEWEYAARGGQLSRGYPYTGSNKLHEVGWFKENSDGETKTIGQKQPNELGLYDMSGNVYEWCQDWFDDSYYKRCAKGGMIDNPPGPENSEDRVIRGGSWHRNAENCRSTYRSYRNPDYRYDSIGFRLVFSS